MGLKLPALASSDKKPDDKKPDDKKPDDKKPDDKKPDTKPDDKKDDKAKDTTSYKVSGDGYEVKVDMSEGKMGGDQITTNVEMDDMKMYGVTNMGGKGNGAPKCGPNDGDSCAKRFGPKSCCAHVLMTDDKNGEQTSMYQCMNQQIVDASFSVSMNNMQINMKCTQAMHIVAGFIASAAIMASALF
jgi:hypothetical protein